MGWSLKIQETKKHGKRYKFWTSIADGWINEKWLTRDEMIRFLFWHRFEKMADKFIEDAMTFPNGWYEKGEYRIIMDEELQDAYRDWQKSTFKVDNYYETLFNKFAEVLNQNEINLKMHDGEYNFDSTESLKKDYSVEAHAKLSEQSTKEVTEIADKYGLTYNQAIEFWVDMNKQFGKQRDSLHPANYEKQ